MVGMAQAAGALRWATAPLWDLGWLYTFRGEWDKAEACLRRSIAIAEGEKDSHFIGFALGLLLELLGLQGRRDELREALIRAEQLDQRLMAEGAGAPHLDALRARAMLAFDRIDEAKTLSDQAVTAYRAGSDHMNLITALWIQAEVLIRAREPQRARLAADELLLLSQQLPAPFWEAQALVLLGSLIDESRERRITLERALATFNRLGAAPYIRRVEHLLEGF
jgi:tetratricopeptide (TPR) repeat protein